MATKQARRRKTAKQREAMNFRAFSVRAQSINTEAATVETIISTETPVPMVDWERYEMVPEVLRSDGMQSPEQVPLLDSHNRNSMVDQYGSVRAIRVDGQSVAGVLHFSANEDAQQAFRMVQEGHATDVSAGYQVLEKTYVPRGQNAVIAGRQYAGPVNVVTKWKLREVSLTPIGADEQAKLRGFEAFPLFEEKEGFEMEPELRALLESRGMPAGLDDKQAQSWMVENLRAEKQEKHHSLPQSISQEEVRKIIAEQVKGELKQEQQRIEKFRAEVDSLLDVAEMPEIASRAYGCADIAAVRDLIKNERAERASKMPQGHHIVVKGDGAQEFVRDIGTALNLRAMDQVAPPADEFGFVPENVAKRREVAREKAFPKEQHAKGADRWRNASLYELAHQYVETIYGVDTRGMTREDIAKIAMFGTDAARKMGMSFRSNDAAVHTTGSFANLTLDAVNKSVRLGYAEAPSTWEGPMRRGTSVSDFKTIHRVQAGAIPNLPLWPDNSDPEKASFADSKESYAVESRSLEISFSYRLLVNDDMSFLSRVPGQMGNAARRTVNTVAWSQITANGVMGDGVALFAAATGNRKRTNLTTGAGTPSTTTLQTLTNLMRQMRGGNTPENAEGADILNLEPRYLVVPSALEKDAKQLVLSVYDPGSANMAYNTASTLIPIVEPLLDSSSATAWYLFADPSQIDTVEVTFLAGQEVPQVRNWMDERNLAQNWTILQTFAAKALDHRGMQKHAGA